ncbi:glycosyltransferase [Brevibacterium album]|uniref:glycosyltransferase n=1 Tax=Brevibacterium album TaxID=417948 RepID=UPI00042227A2|nr:glycosyltransferase [Brevibacterium album]
MNQRKSVLVACDVRYASDQIARFWVDGLVGALADRGWQIQFLAREVDGVERYQALRRTGAVVVTESGVPSDHQDAEGHLARYRARSVIAQAGRLDPDLVIVQGLSLSRFVAGSGRLGHRLWTIPVDRPYAGGGFPRSSFTDLGIVAGSSTRILVADETQRSMLDSEFPEASSKVRVLPWFDEARRPLPADPADVTEVTDLHVREALFSSADLHDLSEFAGRLRERPSIPRILLHDASTGGEASEPSAVHSTLRRLPGLVDGRRFPAPDGAELLPSDPPARHYGRRLAESEGRLCVSLSPAGDPDAAGEAVRAGEANDPFAEADVARVDTGTSRPLRTVIAGSDFKFAGDLVESFLADPGFDVRFDIFAHHSQAQPRASAPYLDWADVVLTEFAVQNAVWYSHNIGPHQTLIVHLHGFELLSDWIVDLDMDRVAAVVVASEFYRRKAHERHGWPLEKIVVIPNSVNAFDLDRPKLDDARHHLGMVGMVPILKRPDRALDLLEKLLTVDSRFTLHIRGHAPWNYSWEWKKAAHQDAYRHFYRRLGERPHLLHSISFEPFAPDMANWLRKIGWVLSPSSRETFHLAAIEGAVSGAVPLAWEREGAREIIGADRTFGSTDEIAEFVLAHSTTPAAHQAVAEQARAHAERYRSDRVGQLWRETVVGFSAVSRTDQASGAPAGVPGRVFREVDELVASGEFDEAKGALDRNIEVTKDDSGSLKVLEMFVRGLLALDARRIDLLPPVRCGGSENLAGPEPRYVRVAAHSGPASPSGLTADPELVIGGIGIVPFGYTGRGVRADSGSAASAPSDPRRHPAMSSGPLITDALEEHLDARIRVSDRLRFDRWVEATAAEVRTHLMSFPRSRVLIDAPWHIALPAALAASRLGVAYVWAPPADELAMPLRKIADHPYTGDLIAQFTGLLVSRSLALISPGSTAAGVPGAIGVLPAGAAQAASGSAPPVFDARMTAEIQALAGSSAEASHLGALNSAHSAGSASPAGSRVRLALVGSPGFVRRMADHHALLDSKPLSSLDGLSPSFDALVVDASIETAPERVPGKGDLVTRVRHLFDLARSLGIVGIFNAKSLTGGDHPITRMAEKADALTGTRAILTGGLLIRNPNSISRVGSASLDDGDAARVLEALSAIGVGRPNGPAHDGHGNGAAPEPARPKPASSGSPAHALSGLALPQSDGVSLIIATRLGADRLPAMLASISAQSIRHSRMELIVVHNGPDDGTAEVVESFRSAHPQLATIFAHSEIEGASEARNLGLQLSTRDYVTFVDDDDEIERNYVLNLWLSAAPDTVVAAPLRDVTPEGVFRTDLPNNRRLSHLRGRRTPLARVSGLLGLNACKLIPAEIARSMRYPAGLHSGEDVVFMSQLLLHPVELVPAGVAPDAAYVRHMRPDSISRRELSRDFGVAQRLAVIGHLEEVRTRGSARITGCVRALQNDQLSFVARYVEQNPAEGAEVVAEVLAAGVSVQQLQGRYTGLHALARSMDASAPPVRAQVP